MSQGFANRQPLMDVGNLSQSSQNTAERSDMVKKRKVEEPPAESKASQIIDLSNEADMTFAFDTAVLPVPAAKPKQKAPAKPRAPPAPKQPAAKKTESKAPAAKKAKKTKIDTEFEKLTPAEQLAFLQSKAPLLEQLLLESTAQPTEHTTSTTSTTNTTDTTAITTKTSTTPALHTPAASADDAHLCSLRLELGSVLSHEADLRTKERRIRLAIKRLQRKMTMALPPVVVTRRDTVPDAVVADRLFAVNSSGSSSASSASSTNVSSRTCSTESLVITNTSSANSFDNATTLPTLDTLTINTATTATITTTVTATHSTNTTTVAPLWQLAQQGAHFETNVAPRLLCVDRDAVLIVPSVEVVSEVVCSESEVVCTRGSDGGDGGDGSADIEAAVADDSDICGIHPTKPPLVSTTLHLYNTGFTSARPPLPLQPTLDSLLHTTDTTSTIDIYEATSSNDGECMDVFTSTNTTVAAEDSVCIRSTAYDASVCADAESGVVLPTFSQYKCTNTVHSNTSNTNNNIINSTGNTINTTGTSTTTAEPVSKRQRTDTSTSTTLVPPQVPPLVALTQPPATSDVVIDLCSPELVPIKHTTTTTTDCTDAPVSSVDQSSVDTYTPDTTNCVIHYVPSTAKITTNTIVTTSTNNNTNTSTNNHPTTDFTPDITNCVIHYVPTDYVESSSEEHYHYLSQPYSQAHSSGGAGSNSENKSGGDAGINTSAGTCSSDVRRGSVGSNSVSASSTQDTTPPTTTTTTTPTTNILHSPTLPDFTTLPLQCITDTILHYGLRVDSRAKMCALLKAMWYRLHPEVKRGRAGKSSGGSGSSSGGSCVSGSAAVVSSNGSGANSSGSRGGVDASAGTGSASATSVSATTITDTTTANTTNISTTTTNNTSTTITTTTTTTNRAITRFDLTLSDLKQYIIANPTLHQQILTFVPIDLDKLHYNIQCTGVYKVSKVKLLEMLDSMCVFVSAGGNNNNSSGTTGGGKGRGKKRKLLSQSSV